MVARARAVEEPQPQPRLRVGRADDRAELEADATATRVVELLGRPSALRTPPFASGSDGRIHRAHPPRDSGAGTDHRSDDPDGTQRTATLDGVGATGNEARVQRSAGASRALSRDAPFVIRRKDGHFSSYLASKDPSLDIANNATDRNHFLASWLLDQNIYDLEAMVTRDAEPELQNVAFLTQAGLNTSDALQLLANIARQLKSPSPMALFHAIVQEFPAAITKRVSGATQANNGPAASEIRWHGLTGWGAGSGVTLVMKPGGLPAGSKPKSEPVWMKTIEQHHPSTNATTLYVRGHLLNHNIGGPGLDYNMVPLTGKPAKNVGANDANAEHLNTIETKAKETWDKVRLGELETATYEVVPKYPQPARAETKHITKQAAMLRGILDDRKRDILGGFANLPNDQRQAAVQQARQHLPPGIPDQIVEAMIAQQQTSAFEQRTVGDLTIAGDPVAKRIATELDQDVLKASASGQLAAQTLRSLLSLVEGNAATWRAEELYVPLELHVRLQTTDANGTNTVSGTVPVKLSTDLAGVYYRPFKKNEI